MRWVVLGAGALFAIFVCQQVALFVQPWAPWWFQKEGVSVSAPVLLDIPGEGAITVADTGNLKPIIGAVTDAQRYQLARAAGFNAADAITATALSIAENGSGNPAALSGENWNKTRDLGLWQVNSIWWAQFGGQAALTDPLTNARAAAYIYSRQSWCAWSTYEASCGPGHTGSYRAFITRAQAAARAGSVTNEA